MNKDESKKLNGEFLYVISSALLDDPKFVSLSGLEDEINSQEMFSEHDGIYFKLMNDRIDFYVFKKDKIK